MGKQALRNAKRIVSGLKSRVQPVSTPLRGAKGRWIGPRDKDARRFAEENAQFALGEMLGPKDQDPKQPLVYFVQSDLGGPFKIGCSVRLRVFNRLAALQTGSPFHLWVIDALPGTDALESELHAKLHEHRIRGEWFLAVEAARAIVRQSTGREDILRRLSTSEDGKQIGTRWERHDIYLPMVWVPVR